MKRLEVCCSHLVASRRAFFELSMSLYVKVPNYF